MPADNSSPSEDAARSLGLRLGAVVGAPVGDRPLALAWRARAAEGMAEVPTRAFFIARPEAPDPERRRYIEAAQRVANAGTLPRTVLRIHAVSVEKEAFVADLWTLGSARDLGALGWSVARRVDFVRKVAEAIEGLHRAGIVHGCLCEENVLLDDDLGPVVAEAGAVSVRELSERGGDAASYAAFAAPEVIDGREIGPRADVYSLGRLLQHVVRSDDAPQVAEIARRCVAPAAAGRYESAGAVAAAIGGVVSTIATEVAPPTPAPRPADPQPAAPAVVAAPSVPPATDAPDSSWMIPVGGGLVVLALVLATLGFGSSGATATFLSVALVAGAAMCAFGLSPTRQASLALRAGFAVAAGAIVTATDPLAYAHHLAAGRALHGNADACRAALAEIVHLGRDFREMPLAGVDMSGSDLRGSDLRGADLSNADLSGVNLMGAMLDGASMRGAKLAGADLRQTDLERASVEGARCDAHTLVPPPFRCDQGVLSGAPAPVAIAPVASAAPSSPSLESDGAAR